MAGKEWDVSQGCIALLGSRYIVLVFHISFQQCKIPYL